MTDNLLHHLRPTTLARLAAEIVISHTDNPGPRDVLNALIANAGQDDAFDLLDQALAAEWDAFNDKLFNN